MQTHGRTLGWVGGRSSGSAPREPAALGEMDEIALASELLEARSNRDLHQVVVRVMANAGIPPRQTGSGVGRMLVDSLCRAAGRVLPTNVAAPGQLAVLGPATTRRPSATAGVTLGLELEGLSPEDRDFEIARHFVRFADDAARRARPAVGRGVPAAARASLAAAARSLAPGLVRQWSAPHRDSPPVPSGDGPEWFPTPRRRCP